MRVRTPTHLVPAVSDERADLLRPVRRHRLPEARRDLLRIVEHRLPVVPLPCGPAVQRPIVGQARIRAGSAKGEGYLS